MGDGVIFAVADGVRGKGRAGERSPVTVALQARSGRRELAITGAGAEAGRSFQRLQQMGPRLGRPA